MEPKPKKEAPGLKKSKAPRLCLRSGENIGEGLERLATIQIDAAIKELRNPNLSQEQVHHIRTFLKKVRAILQLREPSSPKALQRSTRKLLREAAARLAPVRDADVKLQSLGLLLKMAALPAARLTGPRTKLASRAKKHRIRLGRQISCLRGLLKKLRRKIASERIGKLGAKDLRQSIRHTYRLGRKALALCRDNRDPERFHTWRKLTKQLWYQLRITARLWPQHAELLIQSVGKIGELAGEARDFELLAECVKKDATDPSSIRILRAVELLLPKLRKGAISVGSHFYRLSPGAFVHPLNDV